MAERRDELHLPIVEERLSVTREEVETDHVRVRTAVDTHEAVIEDTLRSDRLEVTRTPVERPVTEAPAPYQDGDTLVIPIVEERLVIEKRLFVVEEVRVSAVAGQQATRIPVSLRRTRAIVEHDRPDQVQQGSN